MTPPMTVPHHSEPAREAVACTVIESNGKQWRIVSNDGRWIMKAEGLIDASEAEKLCRLAHAGLTSPAPAAGGLEAVRGLSREDICRLWQWTAINKPSSMTVEGFTSLLLNEIDSRSDPAQVRSITSQYLDCLQFADNCLSSNGLFVQARQLRERIASISPAALASPAATSAETQDDLVSRAEVIRVIRTLGDQDADLALYGAADNARAREYGEAAATRACCAIALMPRALASPAETQGGDGVREDIAKIVYAAMKWAAERAEKGRPPGWVDRGNSLAQVEARRFAHDIAALAPPTSAATRGDGYQARIASACAVLFEGDPTDVAERRDRFAEEANEVCQAFGMTREDAHRLVDYTYSRPVGDPAKEIGAAMTTLASLANEAGHDLMACAEGDLTKLMQPETIARIRSKRATRHGRGPLPGLSPAAAPVFEAGGTIGPGHVCEHGIRWPWACDDCDRIRASLDLATDAEG